MTHLPVRTEADTRHRPEFDVQDGVIGPCSSPGSPCVSRPALGDFSQPGSAGGEEAAQQPACGQLLQPRLPVLRATPQPFENPCQLAGDHGFACAEQPPGVLNQEQVAAQRESLEHTFMCGIKPPSILDRTEPQALFQARRRLRARDAVCSSGVQIVGSSLLLDMLDPLLDRGMLTGLGNLRDSGSHRVQINIGTGRQQRLLVEDRHALEPALEERTALLFAVGQP